MQYRFISNTKIISLLSAIDRYVQSCQWALATNSANSHNINSLKRYLEKNQLHPSDSKYIREVTDLFHLSENQDTRSEAACERLIKLIWGDSRTVRVRIFSFYDL